MGQLNQSLENKSFDSIERLIFERDLDSDCLTLDNVKLPPFAAKEYLLRRLTEIIKHHDMKDFSSRERSGKNDFHARKMIKELTKYREEISSIIEMADEESTNIRVESYLKISFEK